MKKNKLKGIGLLFALSNFLSYPMAHAQVRQLRVEGLDAKDLGQEQGCVLRRATGKSISALTEEWLWHPMGAKDLADWHVAATDKAEAASGGFNASLIAYDRFGMFLLCRVFMGKACWYNRLTKL
jgi:hypothetical protein